MIAALYVQRGGVYWDLPGVDPWDERRDARPYAGPWPGGAHPPCARWGRYWFDGPRWIAAGKPHKKRGDDDGCFASALESVRRYGGVLEHPEASSAWLAFGLPCPKRAGGWFRCFDGGWTCCVEQDWYGHQARNLTWLYVCGTEPPELDWGPSKVGVQARTVRLGLMANLSHRQRAATPVPFRDLLL